MTAFTVSALTWSLSAISALVRPRATSKRVSSSRSLSGSMGSGGLGSVETSANFWRSRAVMVGAMSASADLSDADLSEADLSRANLREARHDQSTMWPDGFEPPPAEPLPSG